MSNEITDAERYQYVKNRGCVVAKTARRNSILMTEAQIDEAILAERKPVVERSTWQNVYAIRCDRPWECHATNEKVAGDNRIAVLRRDFWSNGDVTCDLERP